MVWFNEQQMRVIVDRITKLNRNVDNTEWVERIAQRAGYLSEMLILQQTIGVLDLKNEVERNTYKILHEKVRKLNAKIISINRKLNIYA